MYKSVIVLCSTIMQMLPYHTHTIKKTNGQNVCFQNLHVLGYAENHQQKNPEVTLLIPFQLNMNQGAKLFVHCQS